MNKELSDTIRSSLVYLLLVYVIAVLLYNASLVQIRPVVLIIFAIVLGVLGIALQPKWKKVHVPHWLAYLAVGLAIFVRVLPYLYTSVPLGYDPGIHAFAFSHPFSEDWIKSVFPLPFLLLFSGITMLVGTYAVLVPVFIAFSASTVVAVYLIVRRLYSKDAAVIASILFAISITQFETFWYNYYKNVIGILVLLFSLLFIEDNDRFHWQLIITGVLIGGTHQVALFLFGATYIVLISWSAFKRTRKQNFWALGNGVLMVGLICLTNYDRIFALFLPQLLATVTGFAGGAGGGSFFDVTSYALLSLVYIPFAIIGVWHWRARPGVSVMGLIATTMVIASFFAYNRFISYLDIFVIIFASLGMLTVITSTKRIGAFIVYGLLALGAMQAFAHANNSLPLISDAEWHSIQTINSEIEANATVLATDKYYGAWLKGWVDRPIVSPGLFNDNKMHRSEWDDFWNYTNREEYLKRYPRPLYIHVGEVQPQYTFGGCYELAENSTSVLYNNTC